MHWKYLVTTLRSPLQKVYLVKSTHCKDRVYEINTTVWTCTCSINLTGYPSGEPCKHQHAVANKFNLVAPNLIPYLMVMADFYML